MAPCWITSWRNFRCHERILHKDRNIRTRFGESFRIIAKKNKSLFQSKMAIAAFLNFGHFCIIDVIDVF